MPTNKELQRDVEELKNLVASLAEGQKEILGKLEASEPLIDVIPTRATKIVSEEDDDEIADLVYQNQANPHDESIIKQLTAALEKMSDRANREGHILRRSLSGPLDTTQVYTPENYDVRAECMAKAAANGYSLHPSGWVPVEGQQFFWTNRCLLTGATAFARWDYCRRTDTWTPRWGGKILHSKFSKQAVDLLRPGQRLRDNTNIDLLDDPSPELVGGGKIFNSTKPRK